MTTIGCAENYTVAVMRQAGDMTGQGSTPATLAHLDDVQYVQWSRLDTRRGGATVHVSKCPSNREVLKSVEHLLQGGISRTIKVDPWAHELWIYRDGFLAFQGPIVYIRETRGRYIFEAWDMLGWFARRESTLTSAFNVTATSAADSVATFSFVFPPFFFEDPYLVSQINTLNHSSTLISREWEQNQYTVYDIWLSLISAGLRFTTFGRNVFLFSQIPPNNTNPYILNSEGILGEIEIVKDGINFGTKVVCLGEGFDAVVNPTSQDEAYYGSVTFPPVRVEGSTSQSELDSIAADVHADLSDISSELVIPSGSSLSPEADIFNTGYSVTNSFFNEDEIALKDLICGMRYDIHVSEPDFDSAVYPMRLGEVQVTWTPEEGERVAVSFKNLGFAATQ